MAESSTLAPQVGKQDTDVTGATASQRSTTSVASEVTHANKISKNKMDPIHKRENPK